MRPIKFRGRDLSGKIRYGFYAESAGFPYIIENHTWHEVQRNSVAQLVGYDANNKEVYEGDIVIEEYVDGECTENIAHLESMTQVPETAQFFFFPFPAPFTTLKEQSS